MSQLLQIMKLAKESAFSRLPPGLPPYVYADTTSATLLQLMLSLIKPAREHLAAEAREHAAAGPLDSGGQVKWQCGCRGCAVHRDLEEALS